jgi:hypothetical protein
MVTCGETGLPVFACLSVYDCADIARNWVDRRFGEVLAHICIDGTLKMARCMMISLFIELKFFRKFRDIV